LYAREHRKRGAARKRRVPQEPAQAQARHDAEQTEMRRVQCTLFQFWRGCALKRCRRARRCDGDPHACFERWWPLVPEVLKVQYRAAIVALGAGLSPHAAAQAARAEVERWRASQAPIGRNEEAEAAVPTAAQPAASAAHLPAEAAPATARVRLM
jgi:hypothetical protein